MRPVRLELKGFTSFRDSQVLDFAGLDLFAISGQTGSGKSSLLDAMTYALYGYVERVGKGAGQLVSQGQKRMAVTFDFAVDGTVWRVTRSTPATGGSTKILLERAEGDGWVQAGEGADRVRDVDARVKELIGLDFDGFTRSVLLPQGRFQEFMVGEAKERRRILTDLLGLELFERLNARAGELERAAKAGVAAKSEILDGEYDGVSPEAIAAAEARVLRESEREARLASAEAVVRELDEQGRRERDRVEALSESAAELRDIASTTGAAAEEILRLASTRSEVGATATAAREAAAACLAAADAARATREEEEAASGGIGALADARGIASRLPQIAEKIAAAEAALAAGSKESAARVKAAGKLAQAASEAASALVDVEARAKAARARVEEVVLADRAAAIRAEVHPGEDCPVCGARIQDLPDIEAPDLAHANADLQAAQREVERAKGTVEAADEAVAEAGRDAQRLGEVADRRTAEIEELRGEAASATTELDPLFPNGVPADPATAIAQRIDRLESSTEAERAASARLVEAERAAAEAAAALERIDGSIALVRSRLQTVSLEAALARARRAAGDEEPMPALAAAPALDPDGDPTGLAEQAAAAASHAASAAATLEGVAEAADSGEAERLRRAGEALREVDDVLEGSRTLAELVEAVVAARRRSGDAAARAREEVRRAAERLEKRRALEVEVAGLRDRQARFHDLTQELRSDRIVAFLQAEALRMLAASGSDRLCDLSGGRYRLVYEGEGFFVVDTWNGEEMRAARTLSGGETFLASLALALALSDQVQALAVTQQARLESLFLDEGFGTLDPESLELVVEAIEQLGGDGRMVGIISHVQELAIRLPARIEVEKSPRGSRLIRTG